MTHPRAAFAIAAVLLLSTPMLAAEVLSVRVGEHDGYSRLVFELDEHAGFRVDRCAARRLVVSIAAETASAAIPVLSLRIQGVRLERGDGELRAHIDLTNSQVDTREMILAHPTRIVVDVHDSEADAPSIAGNAQACAAAAVANAPLRATPAEAIAQLTQSSALATPQPEIPTAIENPARNQPLWEDDPEENAEPEPPTEPATEEAKAPNETDLPASPSRISDESSPLRTSEVPERPLTLEIGNPFLGRGVVWEGFELPTGAVWQPSLLVFGTSRLAVQGRQTHETRAEAVARLDLFANLQLSGTERVLVGIRPLDRDGKFTGYTLRPQSEEEREIELNARIRTLFFEGDLGEIFPFLDPGDSRMLDFGISVGRQPMRLQEGLLVDDTFDSVGIVRNNLLPPGASNLRMTALYGWDQIHRGNNQRDRFSKLYALLTSADLPWNTVDLDLLFAESQESRGGDAVYAGLSSVQRIHSFNTALRATGSLPLDGSSAEVDQGVLLFGEVSWTPPVVHDLLYLNAFWGVGDYTSAARGPDVGGPLGRTGILFEAYGIGSLPSPLSSDARRSAGGALGYQMFLSGIRRQLVFELGGRRDTEDADTWSIGAAARFQQAIGQRHVLQIDVAVTESPDTPVTPSARAEWRMRF